MDYPTQNLCHCSAVNAERRSAGRLNRRQADVLRIERESVESTWWELLELARAIRMREPDLMRPLPAYDQSVLNRCPDRATNLDIRQGLREPGMPF